MPWLTRILIGVVVLLLLVIGALAWVFRSQAEAIPQELPALDLATADPAALRLGDPTLPDLVVGELQGKRPYFLLEDRESMQAGESKELNRALARWELPEDVEGYMIGDAKGFGVFRGKINEFMGMMRPEMRLPLYIDYEGAFYDTFKLPRGHTGLVILGPDGGLLHRHSGPASDADLEVIRGLLDGRPPTYPPAPEFAVGDLDTRSCAGKVCLFAFLARPVRKADVPGIEGGFEGGREEGFKQFSEPSIRLVGVLAGADEKIDEDRVAGAIVGDLEGLELRRWQVVAEAADARRAFDLGEDAGLVVVDAEGRLAFKASGKITFWQLGLVADLLGVDLGERPEGG